MDDDPIESSNSSRNLVPILAAAFMAVVLVPISFCGYKAWDGSRLRGEVSAEQLAAEYVAGECGVLWRYNEKTWTVTGTVVPGPSYVNQAASDFAVDGGTHFSDGRVRSCISSLPLFREGANTMTLFLEWDESAEGETTVGDTVRVTCRIQLLGRGFNEPTGIRGTGCRVP